MKTLKEIEIKGFKSIEGAKLVLGDLNVVIGANGSGKSNLIGAFGLLERVLSRNIKSYLGDPDRILHHGPKVTPELSMDLTFQKNTYGFSLAAHEGKLVVTEERSESPLSTSHARRNAEDLALGEKMASECGDRTTYAFGREDLARMNFPLRYCFVYHFHDTSEHSPAKKSAKLDDKHRLHSSGANLPAFLYWVQKHYPFEFRRICELVRLVAPYFECFDLSPFEDDDKLINLKWRQKGSDAYFDAHSLSDGTLRFICLATLLFQPAPPKLILLDEPELGLHPFAINILAEMLESAAKKTQVLVATQSASLLDRLELKHVIVAENDGTKTTFSRPDKKELRGWLKDYSLGELWNKNLLGGRP